jgi:NHL repeat
MKLYLHLILSIIALTGFSWSVQSQIISTIAGNGVKGHSGDGAAATLANLIVPEGLSIDKSGDIYINDRGSFCVRKINHLTGIISAFAGTSTVQGFSGDNGPATNAKFSGNWGVVADRKGNVYISDQLNSRVRKVDAAGTITTIAGTGAYSSFGDGGPALAAGIMRPLGMTIDTFGNLYVADPGHFDIRKIDTSGKISTVAGCGTSGYSGDGGPATLATFNIIYSINADDGGNLFICDAENNCVRKVNRAGIISTFAGNGIPGFSGDGGPANLATMYQPTGVVCDKSGNVYISDSWNNRIRKVNSAGKISTISGTGAPGFSGDGGRAIYAVIDTPGFVTIDTNENLYFSEVGDSRVREIKKALYFKNGHYQHLDACQYLSTSLDSILAAQDLDTGVLVSWSVYAPAHYGTVSGSYSAISTGGMLVPATFTYTNHGLVADDTFTILVTNGIDVDLTTVYVKVVPQLVVGGVINGPSFVCVGDTITLTDSLPGGTWSISNLNAIVKDGIVTGESPGTDSIRYTIYSVCGTVMASKLITIYALPYVGGITGQGELCIGSVIFLSDTISGGIWTVSNTAALISTSGAVTGLSPGFDTVSFRVHDAFCENVATKVIKVDPLPAAAITLADTAICLGTTATITGTPDGGIWKLSNAKAGIWGGILTGMSPGIDTVSYLYTNFCGSATASVSIAIDPLPPVPDIFQNGMTVYAPAGYATYQWSYNGVAVAGANADTLVVENTGLYAVTVTNEYGCATFSADLECTGCSENDIVIYPNPTEGIIYIQWCKKMIIRVLYEDGKIVELAKSVHDADLGYLPNGDYLITIYDINGKKIKTRKVTKWTR